MRKSQLVWGLVFTGIGVLLLLFNYGVISWRVIKDLWKLWPLVFVAIGVGIMLSARREKKIEKEEE